MSEPQTRNRRAKFEIWFAAFAKDAPVWEVNHEETSETVFPEESVRYAQRGDDYDRFNNT